MLMTWEVCRTASCVTDVPGRGGDVVEEGDRVAGGVRRRFLAVRDRR